MRLLKPNRSQCFEPNQSLLQPWQDIFFFKKREIREDSYYHVFYSAMLNQNWLSQPIGVFKREGGRQGIFVSM